MSLLNRIIVSSILGKYYKYYIVLGLSTIFLIIILNEFTDNILINTGIPLALVILVLFVGISKGDKMYENEMEDAQNIRLRHKDMAEKIEITPDKCVSCMADLQGNTKCPNCGYVK